jgi:erythromycin esterase
MIHWTVVALLLTSHIPVPAPAQDAHPDTGFAKWARAHSAELAAPGAATCEDLEFLRPVLARARVLALGELIHDARELHLLRNRLARCLTARFGFTAVAMESGFADAAPLHRALLHPPRSVSTLTREHVSYGWGGIPEVQALMEMIRTSNTRRPFNRRVRLYGIDLTGADGSGHFSRARRSLDELLKYLGGLDGHEAKRLESALTPLVPRFSEEAYPGLAEGARDSLRSILDSARALLLRESARSSDDRLHEERAWALQCVAAARQTMVYLELLGTLRPSPAESPDRWRLLQMRDSIMADNLLWALEQEGPGGRVLLLAHNAHVFADSGRKTIGPALAREPRVLGQRLRAALGDAYVVIGTEARVLGYYVEEQDPPDSTSLGVDLGRVGPRWLGLNLRAARGDPATVDWVEQPRAVRFKWGYQWIRPAVAADFLIYADSLSPTGGELP